MRGRKAMLAWMCELEAMCGLPRQCVMVGRFARNKQAWA